MTRRGFVGWGREEVELDFEFCEMNGMNEGGYVRDFHVVAEFEIGCVHECLGHSLFPQVHGIRQNTLPGTETRKK